MSDFVDEEAELDSNSESGHSGHSEASSAPDNDLDELVEGPSRKKKKKKKKDRRRAQIVDSDEDEEDGEDLDRDLEGLIDDDVIEEDPDSADEGEGDRSGQGKRDRSDEEDEDLSDEDYDLLEENLGIKVKRKQQKRKRIRVMSDDEESAKGSEEGEGDDREAIAREIFEGEEEEGGRREPRDIPMEDTTKLDLSASEAESDPDDFIVDDEGQPISKQKKKKHIIHDDAALQEAQDIFGVDFDFNEFEQDDDEEEMDDYEDDEQEDGAEARQRAKKSAKQRAKRTTIFDVFEPSELERSHFTDRDQEIRAADMPERFQLRGIPVCPTEKGELKEESEWIYKLAFSQPPLSHQENSEQDGNRSNRKGPGTISKIQEALKFMRNQQFEVPFIAFYRKEYVDPDLNINDLWRVYHWDEKWMQLKARKQNLIRLHEKMQEFQFEQVDPEKDLESHVRALTDEDIERARNVQNMDELRDVYQHFMLYYGPDIPKMKASLRAKKKRERDAERANRDGEGEGRGEGEEDKEQEVDNLKQATRKTGYILCVEAGLAELARKYGLTPEQFGENLQDNYQRHDVDQDPAEPLELAKEYVKKQFNSPEEVLKGAQHMVSMQIAHDPLVRKCVRETFYERAKTTLRPTKKGVKEIDESHPCYTFKYLKNKPIRDLHEEQFMRIHQAEQDGLLTYEIHIDERDNLRLQDYFDEIKQLYIKDEFSKHVQEWNDQRCGAIERALNLILFPQLVKELKAKLLEEAKECIIKGACRRLYNCIKVAPYQSDQQLDNDEDEDDSDAHGLRVMGLAYSTDRSEAAYAACIDGDGEVSDFMRLTHILNRRGPRGGGVTWQEKDKANELQKLKDFIINKRPHAIAISAESREALMIMDDLKALLSDLEQEHQMAPVGVELVENDLARVFANSTKGQNDFREYPVLLREAVSLARRLQDPLIEFSQMCNQDEDILSMKFHPMQDVVAKEEILNALSLEFVNRVNEVGVDVNRCVAHPHTATLVQFVCGLGPRKGYHLLKTLKQNNSRLENRTQLVTMSHANMGPKVFINCAGFIKIDTSSLGDSTEAYVEVLDGSRVHPETYEWARKMAVDALEYDDTAEDANPAGALEEILESPERLKDLDLDAFAEELERQGYGNKHITLYDIRAELNHRYKDLRTPYRSATQEERFNMLTKESPATFYIGKLIMCVVTGIAHKRPRSDLLDNADPVRNDETGLWQCPLCQKNDFPDLAEVWNHFDADACPGKAVGVKTRLDNTVSGFIPLKNISDKHVNHPEDRVKVGMTLHCRISKIDIERFQVELTSKTSDLVDQDHKWRLQTDPYYDRETEESDKKKDESKKKLQARQTYTKRVIVHPSFHNIDYKECEKVMANMDQGDVVIRPSSKGNDHLTVTWKVTDGVLSHVDVREEGKENAFSLGSQLIIGNEEFEDLDEIVARYIQPMAAFARDILNYKYYKRAEGGMQEVLDKICLEEKRKAPTKIPYYFSASKQLPGKFTLSYMPRTSTKHEFVTVTPEGLRFRSQIFPSLGALVRWFKEHFSDPIPGSTPSSSRTPMGMTSSSNPNSTPRLDPAAIQRAAAGLPNSVFNSLSQVAGQTPFGSSTFNPIQPITTPMMTPLMTPVQQPLMTPSINNPMATPIQQQQQQPQQHSIPTPQYQPTPRNSIFSNPPPAIPQQPPPMQQPPQQRSMPSTSRPPPQAPQNMTDLAKMAEMWAQKRQKAKQRTPRPEASPMGPNTPRGGSETPLFDEH